MTDVEIIDETVEEVTVYGNDGGGTDTISFPAEMLNYYGGPDLPSIVIPADAGGGGGGGGDVPTVEETVDVLTYAAAGFTVAGMIVGGPVGTVMGIVGVAYGLAAYEQSTYVERSAEADFRRIPGTGLPVRQPLSPPDRSLERLLALERASAVYVDAMACTQGALVAGDAAWTQRQVLASVGAHGELGEALLAVARTLEDQAPRLLAATGRAQNAPADPAKGFAAVLESARPALGLTPDDEAHLMEQVVPALAKGVPTAAGLRDAARDLRRRGRGMLDPAMVEMRFVFVAGPPPAS